VEFSGKNWDVAIKSVVLSKGIEGSEPAEMSRNEEFPSKTIGFHPRMGGNLIVPSGNETWQSLISMCGLKKQLKWAVGSPHPIKKQ
jgi:hypothetical protein